MRVIFMGTPDFSVGTLKALIEAGHEVVLAVTQPDKPKGRGKAMQFPPVKEAAVELGIEVYQPRRVREPECVEYLSRYHRSSSVWSDFAKRNPGNAKIRLRERTCVSAAKIQRCSADPVGSHQRR